MKLLITGGHLSPAVALIQHAKLRKDNVIFVGRDYSSHQAGSKSQEKNTVQQLGFEFVALPYTVKISRHQPIRSLIKLPLLAFLILKSVLIIKKHQPHAVISFGGYLAIPIAIASKLYRKPLITHEQTTAAGLANQYIAKIAHKIAVSYSSSLPYFPPSKTQLTGNLIRSEFYKPQAKPPHDFKHIQSHSILYITGGNQGSVAINQLIKPLIQKLLKSYTLIHQTGDSKAHQSYSQFTNFKQSFPPSLAQKYLIKKWFSAKEVAWILKHARLVISRSGANTVSEIMVSSTPSILIPLPHAQSQEQLKNAQLISTQKAGIILPQKDLTPPQLLTSINQITSHHSTYKQNALKLKSTQPQKAVDHFYTLITSLVNGPS